MWFVPKLYDTVKKNINNKKTIRINVNILCQMAKRIFADTVLGQFSGARHLLQS